MRVALDVTPLLGRPRTGVGQFVAALLDALPGVAGAPALAPYALSGRARAGTADGELPPGTRVAPVPAQVLLRAWGRADQPGGRLLLGGAVAGADVVHGTNFVAPPAGRRPEVITVHDCWCARHPETCGPDVRALFPAARRAVRRGAWVHVGTEHMAHEAREVLGAERVAVVPFGVDAVDRSALGPPPRQLAGAPYLLALGTLDPRKNLDALVAAFGAGGGPAAAHPSLRLVLAGPDGPATPAVEAAIGALPPDVADRVVRLGPVDDATRWSLLAGAAALAYPSLYEGYGFPALEAMSVGTPVVTAAVGGLPEVVGDAAVLVDPTDRDGLAAALLRILDDGALRATLAARGRERAAARSWAATAEGLVALWADLAAGRTPRAAGGAAA